MAAGEVRCLHQLAEQQRRCIAVQEPLLLSSAGSMPCSGDEATQYNACPKFVCVLLVVDYAATGSRHTT